LGRKNQQQFAAAPSQAQTFKELLLPQARHIAGVVVDPEGRPVADARIDHSNSSGQGLTDSEGRFELDTKAPFLVIRKVGFQSERVSTQKNGLGVRVVLRKLNQDRTLPSCSDAGKYVGIKGWASSLRFPRVSGVKVGPQGRDIDYGIRFYYIKTKQGRKGIMHGSGPMWSTGLPMDIDVWRSVKYEEAMFDAAGRTTTDARGQLPNGSYWRDLATFGESASYSDVDEPTAEILDQVLDGVCLEPATHK
jgi:hypothetical protein